MVYGLALTEVLFSSSISNLGYLSFTNKIAMEQQIMLIVTIEFIYE